MFQSKSAKFYVQCLLQIVKMSRQTRRRSSVTRQVLKQIIQNEPNTAPCTKRPTQSIEVIKLNEAVVFLQRKIERQYSQLKVISDQLSKQIHLKEELALRLSEEKQKSAKFSQHLANANRVNTELKKKLDKTEKKDSDGITFKEDYEIKLNKYRDIVRKKDELLTKNQQKLDQLLKNQRNCMNLEQQLKSVKESFGKHKTTEEKQSSIVKHLKEQIAQLNDKIKKDESKHQQRHETLMFAEQKMRRLKVELDQISEESTYEVANQKRTINQLKNTLEIQKQEINQLKQKKQYSKQKYQWSHSIYTHEIKRVLNATLKDPNLKKKVEKGMLEILQQMQLSFNSILSKVIDS